MQPVNPLRWLGMKRRRVKVAFNCAEIKGGSWLLILAQWLESFSTWIRWHWLIWPDVITWFSQLIPLWLQQCVCARTWVSIEQRAVVYVKTPNHQTQWARERHTGDGESTYRARLAFFQRNGQGWVKRWGARREKSKTQISMGVTRITHISNSAVLILILLGRHI